MEGYNPIKLAEVLRPRLINLSGEKVLIANLAAGGQLKDVTVHTSIATNFFRAKAYTKSEESNDPFRGEPASIAAEKLAIPSGKKNITVSPAQCNSAFLGQINGCNLRCWYCYVDDVNRCADLSSGEYYSAEEILMQFLIWSKKTYNSADPDEKLNILRLSGGEVFIIPEIIIWTIDAIKKLDLQDYIYVWVDSNLSTDDFYWKYLSDTQREKIRNFRNMGFCGCYKGIDGRSFFETTGADPSFFDNQFKMHRRLLDEGLDVYSYLYLVINPENIEERLASFIDRLEIQVDNYAPLRMATPPIKNYSPTIKRLTPFREELIKNQPAVMEIWKRELQKRFVAELISLPPHRIPLKHLN